MFIGIANVEQTDCCQRRFGASIAIPVVRALRDKTVLKMFLFIYKEMETAEKSKGLPQSSCESSCPDSAATRPFSLLDYFPVAVLRSLYPKQGDFGSNKVPKACS